jgi:hypothetical protein
MGKLIDRSTYSYETFDLPGRIQIRPGVEAGSAQYGRLEAIGYRLGKR